MRTLRIDIVSDVVCPWCIIGYKRLQAALSILSNEVRAEIHWHPFELNPTMAPGGENLREHLARKYGTTPQASQQARDTLIRFGQEAGFSFQFFDDMRIYNTRKAHQLLMWANQHHKQGELEMLMFDAYFCQGQVMDDDEVLLGLTEQVGLNRAECQQVLADESWAKAVANTEQQWLQAGIHAVPAIIIEQRHLISGAQTTENLLQMLREIVSKSPTH
ncbi:DsbA family oxidoreductase [Vibrio fluvialis]|uniref:DsbA family oxidoreductase n=1 Tax=Vibrio fluvialis TaxID=676 RepID=UPI00192CC9BB|nr:DsbA family oxidoreductase [Vibrio fluvialis]MBL4288429.1 DsbA family oxidoreductase [Vibrio fluvialis]MBL4292239.1 DsbA family oxidoreductase [Vibrio fluvialis]